jgi:Flp pilus assembly pilin Flp
MTGLQRNAISSPVPGLMIWCTDCGTSGELQVFNGSDWVNFIGGTRQLTSGLIGSDIDGEAANDYSGCSVSLSSDGSTVAIGAYANDGTGSNAGHVGVYEYISSTSTWTQVGADIDGEAVDDQSGWSVSLSSDGSTVAIGAKYNDGTGSYAGHVRIYKNISGTWTQQGSDIDGEAANDLSGVSVTLSSDGSIVAIGAIGNDGTGSNAGHVRIYQNISGTWTQVGADIDGEAVDDQSGGSVSLSSDGSIVAIGATGNDGTGSYAGHVRVYENISGTWTQVGADIDGEAADDQSGGSVSLSSDGSTVAIGAIGNDGTGSYAGHVRIYKNISGTWTQVGADIDGEAAGDRSGDSVSLSSDGSIVAIGATGNNGTGSYAGHVRVQAEQL